MKRIRKILVILSLSFLMTSVLIPEREKEAHAFILTGSMVLGAIAVAGMGGVIAYHNRDAIQKVGSDISERLSTSGVSVTDMFARNEYGLNRTLTEKMAESLKTNQQSYAINTIDLGTQYIAAGSTLTLSIPQAIHVAYRDNDKSFVLQLTSDADISLLRFGYNSNIPRNYTNNTSTVYTLESLAPQKLNITFPISEKTTMNQFRFNTYDYDYGVEFNIKAMTYTDATDSGITQTLAELPSYETNEEYIAAMENVFANNTVSIDYDRLTDIMTNAQSEPISTTNLESLVSGLGTAIEDAGSDTVGALTTIWNGIKNIPSLIQTSSAAVLGGISSLSDDLLTGLGNFVGNITAANDQLWNDAGAVWSGLVENINTANNVRADYTDGLLDSMRGGIDNIRTSAAQNTSDLLERLSTGIDNIRDFTGSNATALGNNIATGIDNIKTFTSTNTAIIGDNIQTAATSITDKVTSAATSVTDTITGIAVPSTSAIDNYKLRITSMNEKFKKKFEFIMVPIQSLKDLYSKPKSLFDVEMVLMDTKVRVLPESFRSSVSYIKPLLNGVIVLLTFMSIYKKIQGKEVV